ncbi:putative EF-hand domain-containing protein [Helianthus debilis subsp. tardiflorus]
MSIWYCTGHFRYRYPFFGTFYTVIGTCSSLIIDRLWFNLLISFSGTCDLMKISAPWCSACVEMAVNTDKFELYFKRADVDQDGRVSGSEAVLFFQASGLHKSGLAQVYASAWVFLVMDYENDQLHFLKLISFFIFLLV